MGAKRPGEPGRLWSGMAGLAGAECQQESAPLIRLHPMHLHCNSNPVPPLQPTPNAQHARRLAQVSYVKRHKAQTPAKSAEELEHTRWASSLRNWCVWLPRGRVTGGGSKLICGRPAPSKCAVWREEQRRLCEPA